jgi:DNA polymerase III subunit epsilon
MVRQARLGETPFAAVDVETTGLFPEAGDRIVELAIVELDPTAQEITRTYSTLVNPRRDVGPTRIHGITASDVVAAPAFGEISGDAAAMIDGHVLVAHNVRFDLGFLRAGFRAVGVCMPELPAVCTLHLASRFFDKAEGRGLHQCCAHAGIPLTEAHTATGDATATALLLRHFLSSADDSQAETLEALGCSSTVLPEAWCHLRPRGLALPRRALRLPPPDHTFLARLVENLPACGFQDADNVCYAELLDRCLEDRLLTPEEAGTLITTARQWGLSRDRVRALHEDYLRDLVGAAAEDRVVTLAERRDLDRVRLLLGLAEETLTDLLDEAIASGAQITARAAGSTAGGEEALRGNLRCKRVCFSGDMMGPDGKPIARDEAEALAASAGLVVQNSVTKKLGLLVVADVASQSTKAEKARRYAIPIVTADSFWRALAAGSPKLQSG